MLRLYEPWPSGLGLDGSLLGAMVRLQRHPGVPGLGQMGLKAARGGTHHLIQ